MKNLKTNRGISGMVLCAFAAMIFLIPNQADARWVDHSDELPGTDGPSLGTVVLIGVVGGLAIGGLVLLMKGKKADEAIIETDTTDAADENSTDPEDSDQDLEETVGQIKSIPCKFPQSNLNLYVNCDRLDFGYGQQMKALDFSNLEMRVGLAYNF